MIDDEPFDRTTLGLKSKSELLRQSGEDRRWGVWIGRSSIFRGEVDLDIDHSDVARTVDHWSSDHEGEPPRQRRCRHPDALKMRPKLAVVLPARRTVGQ